MKNNMLKPVVIDAGARYGLHPTWENLKDFADFNLFDIDKDECQRLEKKYSNNKNIKIHHLGLHSNKGILEYQESSHKALNSFYEILHENLEEIDHMTKEFKPTIKKKVELDTVDNLFKDEEVHFFKLDVEGAELELLKGAKDKLEESILGIRCEVAFRPLYKGSPLFSDINHYISGFGFELLNLDYNGKGVSVSPFTTNEKYGYLVTTDGVWIPRLSKLFDEKNQEKLEKNIIYLCVFLFQNGATDVAIHLLLKGNEKGLKFYHFRNEKLFKFLEKEILMLFKNISYYPQLDKLQLSEVCQKILGYDFPDMHHFFEKIDFIKGDKK